MVRPIDPAMARNLADRIECLPDHVNDPFQMSFVQEALRGAFEQLRSDRDLLAKRFELDGDPREAERLRQPVASIPLPDRLKSALREACEKDPGGVFEEIERDAAEVGEWLKEHRHLRDSERFREYLKFVCVQALIDSAFVVEVGPEVFELDLVAWKKEAVEPLCNYLRELADEMATEPAGGGSDVGDKMILLTEAQRIFGFKNTKALSCFLDNHPEVKQDRPLTKDGKPHQRRRRVSILGLSRAISQDDKILSDPVRRRRMENRLRKAKLDKKLEDEAVAYFGSKNK